MSERAYRCVRYQILLLVKKKQAHECKDVLEQIIESNGSAILPVMDLGSLIGDCFRYLAGKIFVGTTLRREEPAKYGLVTSAIFEKSIAEDPETIKLLEAIRTAYNKLKTSNASDDFLIEEKDFSSSKK